MQTRFEMAARHWIGTVPKNSENAKFWENPNTLEHIAYIKLQEEKGHGSTAYEHYQVYICLKERKRLTWLKKHIHRTAHWEKKRGTVAEAIDYVSKADTRVEGGIQFEYGEKPREREEAATAAAASSRSYKRAREQEVREKEEPKKDAQDILERMSKGELVAWKDVPADVKMLPSFLSAYRQETKDALGPRRDDLKIITIIGPPGCGKSYAISEVFPKAGKACMGNNGLWFCNPRSEVMVFEEFSGQIPLQNMLKFLDPYPLALETKGAMEPAMYRLVIITSNTDPGHWYANASEFRAPTDGGEESSAKRRRTDALAALWDRIGYRKLMRECGICVTYEYNDTLGVPMIQQFHQIRAEIMNLLKTYRDLLFPEPPAQIEEAAAAAEEHDDGAVPAPAAAAASAEEHDHGRAPAATEEEEEEQEEEEEGAPEFVATAEPVPFVDDLDMLDSLFPMTPP